jgi:predicted DNA-binding transcriptional regulator AlpA
MERLIYNSQEASQLLGISRSTLLRLTKAKALHKVNISSRRVGWARSELLRYISENTPN